MVMDNSGWLACRFCPVLPDFAAGNTGASRFSLGMTKLSGNSGCPLFTKLKQCIEKQDLTSSMLDHYLPNMSDSLRGLANGCRKANLRNTSKLAEAVWGLVKNPTQAAADKKATGKFWTSFSAELGDLLSDELLNLDSEESLKQVFHPILGLLPDKGRDPSSSEQPPREHSKKSDDGSTSDAASSYSFPEAIEPHFRRVAENLAQAKRRFGKNWRHSELIQQHVSALARTLESDSDQLRMGDIVTDYDDCSLLTARVVQLSDGDELLGLTDWDADHDWWETGDAQKFREANDKAVGRGATIRRTFVYDKRDEELTDEMNRHVVIGVEVRAIERSQLPPNMLKLCSQCVLKAKPPTGSWLTYSVTLDKQKPIKNVFSIQTEKINLNERYLEALWNRAKEYPTQCDQKPGSCEEPSDTLSPTQLVSADQNDGRRLYIHETAFEQLAMQGRDAVMSIYSGLVAVPVVKLVHHDLAEEAVATSRLSRATADALGAAITNRWFNEITESLRRLGFVPDDVERRLEFLPLLGLDERVVATCLDANYYTFATTEKAAVRMYLDVLDLKKVRQYVRLKGDAYRDVTMIKGNSLAPIDPRLGTGDDLARQYSARMRPTLAVSDLVAIKSQIMATFERELKQIIVTTVPNSNLQEAEVLGQFEAKCLEIVRRTVLHLRNDT